MTYVLHHIKHIFLSFEKVKRPLQLHKLTISYVKYEMKDYHVMYILGENVQNCNERSRIISNFLTSLIKQKTKEPFSIIYYTKYKGVSNFG